MNLGQAVAVCLYELMRDAKPSRLREDPQAAAAGELERVTALLFEVLRSSGYLPLRPSATAEDKIRRLVRRLELQAGDAELWLGMLRQIAWKLREAE